MGGRSESALSKGNKALHLSTSMCEVLEQDRVPTHKCLNPPLKHEIGYLKCFEHSLVKRNNTIFRITGKLNVSYLKDSSMK